MVRTNVSLVLLLTAVWLAVPAGATSERPGAALKWESTAENARETARDFERLYLTLYNTGNLATKTIENPKGEFVETLLRDSGLFHGAYFPETMDSLLCDLNREVCKRRLTPAPASMLDSPTGHVGGYLPSRGNWTFSAGATLTVPDYQFESLTWLRKTPVEDGWTPDNYNPPSSLDCSSWQMDCATLVRQLNPPLIKSQVGSASTAVLPVAGYTTEIPLRPDSLSTFSDLLDELSDGQAIAERKFAVPEEADYYEKWEKQFQDASPTDLTIQSLEQNLRSIGRASKFSVRDEPGFDHQAELFALIDHPYGADEALPSPFDREVEILVLDADFNPVHCDLPDGASAAATTDCAEIVSSAHGLNDHGAHVVGLIAAPMNGRGIVGLNPNAKVNFQPIDRTFATGGEIRDIQQKLVLAGTGKARIANASWGFDRQIGGGNDLRNSIDILQDLLLIVAAAGNEGRNVADDCRVFPACLHDLDNVITVVGIDRDPDNPQLWRTASGGSNSNKDFHIAAIADNVLSTVPDNKLGRLSGTSQAAPQVSAAASMIYAAAELVFGNELAQNDRLPPRIVKHRLMYTADVFPSLNSVVKSGRLNVRRAMGIFDSVIVLKNGNERHTLVGRITKNPNDIITCFDPAGQDAAHGWAAIRRLVYMPLRDRYVIFKHVREGKDVPSREADLVRVDGCNMNSLSHIGRIVPRGTTEEVEFRLGDIVDYTSALFP